LEYWEFIDQDHWKQKQAN